MATKFGFQSVSAKVGLGLGGLALLMVLTALFSLITMKQLDDATSRLIEQDIPKVTRAAEVIGTLQHFVALTEALASVNGEAGRRIYRDRIEEQLYKARRVAANINDAARASALLTTLAALQLDINELDTEVANALAVNEHITALRRRLEQFGVDVAVLVAEVDGMTISEKEKRMIVAWLNTFAVIANNSLLVGTLSTLSDIQDRQRATHQGLNMLTRGFGEIPIGVEQRFSRLEDQLVKVLMGDNGYFRALEESINHQRNIEILRQTAMGRIESSIDRASDLFDSIKEVAQAKSLVLSRTVGQFRASVAAASVAALTMLLGLYLFFRNTLTLRLARLNDAILNRIRGNESPIDQDGNDEIAEIAGSVGYFISEIDKRQSKLMASESQFRNLVEGAVLAILILRDQEPVFYNVAFNALIGLPAHAGRRTVSAAIKALPREILETRPNHTQPSETRRQQIQRPGQPDLWVDYSVSPIFWRGESCLQFLFIDVTRSVEAELANQQAKERAEMANRSKNEFLASMSHELRTPLNAIIGFSDALLSGIHGPIHSNPQREYIKDIHDAGNHLHDLVNDILDLSRIEVDELDLMETTCDAREISMACERLVRDRADMAKIAIALDIADDLPPLHADPRRMKQILVNLLTNAIKFSHDGGTVELSGRLNDLGGLRFTVTDHGIGIAEEHINKVLDPFFQVDDLMTRSHEGAGIGLALTRRLVALHNGTLTIESRLGEGTTVMVNLPPDRLSPRNPQNFLNPASSH